jgi:chemotaxis family two-component system sensor kinase Cph1
MPDSASDNRGKMPDLSQCADEPIQRPGSIQPHGVLLVVHESSLTVLSASDNVPRLLPGAPTAPGTTLSSALGEWLTAEIVNRLAEDDLSEPIRWTGPAAGPWAGQSVDVLLHHSGERLVVELEATTTQGHGRSLTLSAVRLAIDRIGRGQNPDEVLNLLTRAVRRVTGFDRVMIYRFDQDWHGEVVAEDRSPEFEPWLGLRYPESDIPAQARMLYTLNRLRFIVDSRAVPSRMVPLIPEDGGGDLNMSYAPLRSVSPVHLEYLAGMGVRASMSVSMLRNGRLWGLVACHHYSETLQPSHDERAAADLLTQSALQIVTERQAGRDAARLSANRRRLDDLTTVVERSNSTPLAALADTELSRLTDLAEATGLILRTGERWHHWGRTIDDKSAESIVRALRRHDGNPEFTSHLDGIRPGLGQEAAAGALLMYASPRQWVLWLREGRDQEIRWAGDPDAKTVTVGTDGSARIGPRRSFATHQQIVRGRSLPWDSWKVQAVAELGTAVLAAIRRQDTESLSIAEDLHEAQQPTRLPTIPGHELVVRYIPAPGGRFAGDWWDAFELPDRKLALVVGDVAGHGSAAAATMAQLRTALRAYLIEGRPPAETLARLDALAHLLFPEKLTTVVLAVIDLKSGDVHIARAGHPHPILATATGVGTVPVPARPPIGVGVESAADTLSTTLDEGQILVLHTDGLHERRELSLAESGVLLSAAVVTAYTDALPVIADRLLTAVPGTSNDDVTVLIVRRTTGKSL